MIKQQIVETALEIGVRAKRDGLFVDRGIEHREEYRLTSRNSRELLQVYLGFLTGKATFTPEALKIVVVEHTDAANETYSMRVLTDLKPEAYEDPFAGLVLEDLNRFAQDEPPLVVVSRIVSTLQVERALYPDRFLHGPMIFEEDRYFAA